MKVLIIGWIVVVAFVGCTLVAAAETSPLPYYNAEDFTPHWMEPDAEELDGFHQIPDFSFTNQDGNAVTSETFDNKIYVASFFFTSCPGICPTLVTRLSGIQKEFLNNDQVRILSHSAMPEVDQVPVLRRYADRHKIRSDKWDLVTGPKAAIYDIAKKAYFASEDMGEAKGEGDFLHTEKLLLIDTNKRIRGVYNGLSETAMVDLATDINLLLSE